jgi:hypothetical protein
MVTNDLWAEARDGRRCLCVVCLALIHRAPRVGRGY